MAKVHEGLEKAKRMTPRPTRPRRPGCYGNTHARILGYHSKRELRALADVLEVNDYESRERATCMPAYKALKEHNGYRKLYGERLYASAYPSKTPNKGFLDLPGELRNRIYSLILKLDTPIEFVPITSQGTNKAPMRVRLCSRTPEEAPPDPKVLAPESCGACGAYFLRAFMETIGPANAASLRKLTVHIHWPGSITDPNDIYVNWNPQYIGRELHVRNLQTHDGAPAVRPFAECLRIFEEAGKLTDLTLVLPYAFSVSDARHLGVDIMRSNFDKLKIKLLHLRKDSKDEAMDETQTPLQKVVRLGRARRRVETEWADPEVFAQQSGWEYEVACYDRKGRYPVDDPYGRV
ncbi:hypothetical protein LTR65_009468 [Meristemomyces frigidus]